jgi:hypothetical protein
MPLVLHLSHPLEHASITGEQAVGDEVIEGVAEGPIFGSAIHQSPDFMEP